jgi:hypothetical protein
LFFIYSYQRLRLPSIIHAPAAMSAMATAYIPQLHNSGRTINTADAAASAIDAVSTTRVLDEPNK